MLEEEETMLKEEKTMFEEETMLKEKETMLDEEKTMFEEETMLKEKETMVEEKTIGEEKQMFYSQQLLSRNVPLGQIWMAATIRAKFNLRNLDNLNLIHICEMIINPVVPMALRLSGILMSGVAIMYERKVNLLHRDYTTMLLEIHGRVKAAPDQRDRSLLPKSKTQAMKEAVTLPEVREEDVGMKLDADGSYFNIDPQGEIEGEHLHQAEDIPDHNLGEPDEQRQGPVKRKPRKQAVKMDNEDTVIHESAYKSWLANASSISGRRTKKMVCRDITSKMKVRSLMELPHTIFIGAEVRTIPSSESGHGIPEVNPRRNFGHSGSRDIISTMKIQSHMELPFFRFIGSVFRTIPSSESGHGIPEVINSPSPEEVQRAEQILDHNLGERDEQRQGPVKRKPRKQARDYDENITIPNDTYMWWLQITYDISRTKKKQLDADGSYFNIDPQEEIVGEHLHQECLVETGPTRTQQPIIGELEEEMIDSIRMQMQSHFETPGATQSESFDKFAAGISVDRVAILFCGICVLATRGVLRVEQKFPYGEIHISRGRNM